MFWEGLVEGFQGILCSFEELLICSDILGIDVGLEIVED